MINPLDYMPDAVKARFVDGGLTRLADAADRAGSRPLSRLLRSLRTDTPFVEDVSACLTRAIERFEANWSTKDSALSELITDPSLWTSTGILDDLAFVLMRPALNGTSAEYENMLRILRVAASGRVGEERLRAGLDLLVAAVRDELFLHPKLQPVHSLMMQRATLESQMTILEVLKGTRDTGDQLVGPPSSSVSGGSEGVARSRPASVVRDPSPKLELIVHPSMTSRERLPDILTPVLSSGVLVRPAYEPMVGAEAADWLVAIQRRVITTTEAADFQGQQEIANELLSADLGLAGLQVSAHYLLGESQRLQADFVGDPTGRARLLAAASESYGTALSLDPSTTRALRGLGRVHEVQGDLGSALALYKRARGAALNALSETDELCNAEYSHEAMRSTRHYVACISRAVAENRQSSWSLQSRQLQLHGLVLESEELHRRILPGFSADAGWMRIEWFMGLVLLAQAYAGVGDVSRCWSTLLHALSARLDMLGPDSRELSPVERGNLSWWCRTAAAAGIPIRAFGETVERMSRALADGDVDDLWRCLYDAVEPIRPPWIV